MDLHRHTLNILMLLAALILTTEVTSAPLVVDVRFSTNREDGVSLPIDSTGAGLKPFDDFVRIPNTPPPLSPLGVGITVVVSNLVPHADGTIHGALHARKTTITGWKEFNADGTNVSYPRFTVQEVTLTDWSAIPGVWEPLGPGGIEARVRTPPQDRPEGVGGRLEPGQGFRDDPGAPWGPTRSARSTAGAGAEEHMRDAHQEVIDAVAWLEKEAHQIIRASRREMKDGTAAFPPQVGIGYEAFWLRDYAYTLEGSIASYSDKELTDACRCFVRGLRADGAGVDCVKFDGTPIYKPGYGSMGKEPVLDGPPFTVSVAWHTYRRTQDRALLDEMLDPLVKTMHYLPRNATNGLAHIAFPGERCPYGFTDSIPKSGDELFCSLLTVQAARQLGDLLEAGGRRDEAQQWRQEAERVGASVRRVFWDPEVGLFRATTGNCKVPDIWGSAFAVRLGVADGSQANAIARYFQVHDAEIVQDGYVRHLPGFTGWDGQPTPANGGIYQSGAFWAAPVGWFVYTLDLVDPARADRTVVNMVDHFKKHGACEWINGETRQLPHYLASAALPLEGIRAMLERRKTAQDACRHAPAERQNGR